MFFFLFCTKTHGIAFCAEKYMELHFVLRRLFVKLERHKNALFIINMFNSMMLLSINQNYILLRERNDWCASVWLFPVSNVAVCGTNAHIAINKLQRTNFLPGIMMKLSNANVAMHYYCIKFASSGVLLNIKRDKEGWVHCTKLCQNAPCPYMAWEVDCISMKWSVVKSQILHNYHDTLRREER